MWRRSKFDRALRPRADAVFRLQRAKSPEAWRRDLGSLRERRSGEAWASLRRAQAGWTMNVVLPLRLPRMSVPTVQDLDQLAGWMEANMKPWSEQIEAKGRAEGRAEGRVSLLVNMARQKFGEASASAMAALLEPVTSEAMLDEVGRWLITCRTGDALIAKVREF